VPTGDPVDPGSSLDPWPASSSLPPCEPVPQPTLDPTPLPVVVPPSIRTNKSDYAPGALVTLLGEGWQPGEEVALFVNDDRQRSWQHQGAVAAGDSGRFEYELTLPSWFVATYTVVATGAVSGEATWQFDDSIGTGPWTSGDNGSPAASQVTVSTPVAMPGDLMLAAIAVQGLGPNQVICTPVGWTTGAGYRVSVNGAISLQVFYRVATGGEAVSYTWRLRANSGHCRSSSSGLLTGNGAVGGITAYTGVDTEDPGGPIAGLRGATGTGSSLVAPSAAGAPDGAIVVRHFASDRASTISTAGLSSTGVENEQVYAIVRIPPGGAAEPPSAAAADADQAAAGDTGTLAASNGGAGGSWAALTVALRARPVQPVIQLELSDPSAQFGTNLTPDGSASTSPDGVSVNVDAADPSLGACYEWNGRVTVRSNVRYQVTVRAAVENTHLGFLTGDPDTYAACRGGEPVEGGMFAGASPRGAWTTPQAATASGRDHAYWLGLDVRWDADPSASIADASLTIAAVAAW
jgi:hypothetical protein